MDCPELISCGISKYALGFYVGKIYRDCKENKKGEEKRREEKMESLTKYEKVLLRKRFEK